MADLIEKYNAIRNGENIGFYKLKRGLIEVSGGESVQFLDGLITNDMKTLEDGEQMLAAFPNAKGRMLAVVNVFRNGEKYLFETEVSTYQKVYENLFRFTFAGDFFVEDLSENYQSYRFFGNTNKSNLEDSNILQIGECFFVAIEKAEEFEHKLKESDFIEISNDLYKTLRIENGIREYEIDMDEETVVPEVGLENLISYNKGCYIGQEVIARIHFRGKVAKQLIGLVFDDEKPEIEPKQEIKSLEDKNAGFLTSITYSPKLEKTIALAYVRNAFLEERTELKVSDFTARVKTLPFVK